MFETKVIGFDSIYPHIKLSKSLSIDINNNNDFRVVALIYEDKRYYFSWIGDIYNNNNNNNIISIPKHQLITLDINNKLSKDYLIDFNCDVTACSEVFVSPKSSFDWEIISTRADSIEEIFIRQHAIVYSNQIIRLYLSNTIFCDLIVNKVLCNKDIIALGKLSIDTAIIVSPWINNNNMNKDITNQSINSLNRFISLRVLPIYYRDKDTSERDFERIDETIELNNESINDDYFNSLLNINSSSTSNNNDTARDQLSVLIHRNTISYLIDSKDININHISNNYLAIITNSQALTSNNEKTFPINRISINRILVTASIRANHISVPKNTKLSMQLYDYSKIILRLVNINTLMIQCPISITFQEIVINNEDNKIESNNDIVSMVLDYYDKNNNNTIIPLVNDSVISITNKYYIVRFILQSDVTSIDKSINDIEIPNLILLNDFNILSTCCTNNIFKLVDTKKSIYVDISIINEFNGQSLNTDRYISVKPFLDCYNAIVNDIISNGTSSNFNRSIILGNKGSGKTTLTKMINQKLHENCHCLLYVRYYDCLKFKNLSIVKIFNELSNLVIDCKDKSPSILILDNIDSICPNINNDNGIHIDQSKYNQILLISLYLERLLLTIKDHNVYVLSTAQSIDSTFQNLIKFHMFNKCYNLPNLTSHHIINIIKDYLSNYNISIQLSNIEIEKLKHHIESLVFTDIINLSKKLLVRTLNKNSKSISFDDINECSSTICSITGSLNQQQQVAYTTNWNDIGGLFHVKKSIKEIIQYPMIFRKIYKKSPVKLSKGMLLYGPSGCGKTLIAQGISAECGMNFLSIKGPELLNKYIGESEKSIRDLFYKAMRSDRPTIIFFDEFEAIAPKRGKDNTGVTDRVVNQLLTFLDGVESVNNKNDVFIIAATSRPDMIDPALLRPGRIESHVYVGYPETNEECYDILKTLTNKLLLTTDCDRYLQSISNNIKDMQLTPADIKGLVDSAYVIAVHESINTMVEFVDVTIQSHHIKRAFDSIRPSISRENKVYYDKIYNRFRYKDSNNSNQDYTNQKTSFKIINNNSNHFEIIA